MLSPIRRGVLTMNKIPFRRTAFCGNSLIYLLMNQHEFLIDDHLDLKIEGVTFTAVIFPDSHAGLMQFFNDIRKILS